MRLSRLFLGRAGRIPSLVRDLAPIAAIVLIVVATILAMARGLIKVAIGVKQSPNPQLTLQASAR